MEPPHFYKGVNSFYPVRNNAPLLPPGQAPPRKGSCPRGASAPEGGSSEPEAEPEAAAGLDFRIIPAGFNAPLEFLTGFTPSKASEVRIEFKLRQHGYGKPIYHSLH